MKLTGLIAKHLRDVYFGGNWTAINMKDTLAGINWQKATTKWGSLNTIASLVFHINYYVGAISKVLEGKGLDASDKFSFDLSPINTEDEWQALVSKAFDDAEALASRIEEMDESLLFLVFAKPEYGNYYRNLHGLIELYSWPNRSWCLYFTPWNFLGKHHGCAPDIKLFFVVDWI